MIRDAADSDVSFPVLVFDGNCVFCSRTVQFLLKADKQQVIRFAAGDADFVKRVLPVVHPQSVMLFHQGRIFQKSAAVFEACRLAGGLLYPVSVLRFLPDAWCDRIYDMIARNRYRWFGKQATCILPDAYPGRFLA